MYDCCLKILVPFFKLLYIFSLILFNINQWYLPKPKTFSIPLQFPLLVLLGEILYGSLPVNKTNLSIHCILYNANFLYFMGISYLSKAGKEEKNKQAKQLVY